MRRVGKATAHGWFRLAKGGFPFQRASGGWQLQFEVDCPGQKWQGFSEWRAPITQMFQLTCNKCFWGNGKVPLHLNLNSEVFAFRILNFLV